MKKSFKRFISVFIAVIMVLTSIPFTVFANEEIRYHITEKSGYSEIVTESKVITADVDVEDYPENGADWINQMLVLKEQGDIKLLEDKMEKFETRRYMSKKLFTILQ